MTVLLSVLDNKDAMVPYLTWGDAQRAFRIPSLDGARPMLWRVKLMQASDPTYIPFPKKNKRQLDWPWSLMKCATRFFFL
jgi:hypothetical protein